MESEEWVGAVEWRDVAAMSVDEVEEADEAGASKVWSGCASRRRAVMRWRAESERRYIVTDSPAAHRCGLGIEVPAALMRRR